MNLFEKFLMAVLALCLMFALFLIGGATKLVWDCLYQGQEMSGSTRC